MTTILHRYLFREIAATFLFGILIFTLILFTGKILQLAELVFTSGASVTNILRLFLYLLPTFSLVTIPMSYLLAVLLSFARLSSDNEITAMKSCGISLYSLLPSVLATALIACLATSLITTYALPWGQKSFRNLMFDFLDASTAIQLKEGVFNDQIPGVVIYTQRYNPRDSSMGDILIQDEREGQPAATIFAREGVIVRLPEERSVRLHLADGIIHQAVKPEGYRLISFNSYDVTINFAKPLGRDLMDERYLSYGEIRNALNTKMTPKVRNDYLIEYHRRIALPFASFSFALLGVPLGIQNRRSGRSGGFTFSIAIILCYYVLLSLGTAISLRLSVPVWVMIWLPNILFCALGIWLYRGAAKEQEFTLMNCCVDWVQTIRDRFSRREETE